MFSGRWVAPETISIAFIMTTLHPREPYTQEELKALYPDRLELKLVQIVSFSEQPNWMIIDLLLAHTAWYVKIDNRPTPGLHK
jgi:hypothetical protein